MTDQTAATECAFADEGCTCGRPSLRLTAETRPVPSPETRMRDARLVGNQADVVLGHPDTTDRSFAAYLTAQDRDQLDARAAAAEQERDEALDARDVLRAEINRVEQTRQEQVQALNAKFQDALWTAGQHATTAASLRQRLDQATAERDDARRLAALTAEQEAANAQIIVDTRAERDQARQVAGIATDVLAVVRDAGERIDRALAVYDTTPGEPAERENAPHEDPSRLREQLAEAHADCARYATGRDEAQRLLNQTAAALNVALHHANDNTSYAPWTDHYKQRAAELDGCRIALQEATEATTAAPSSVPPRRAQEREQLLAELSGGTSPCVWCPGVPVFDSRDELLAHVHDRHPASRPQDDLDEKPARRLLDQAVAAALPLAGGRVRKLLKALRHELVRVDAKRAEQAQATP